MRFSIRSAGLVLGAALFALAPAARADFTLQFLTGGKNPDGFTITQDSAGNETVKTSGSVKVSDLTVTGDAGTIHVTGKIDGYTFDVTGTSNRTTGGKNDPAVVAVDAKVTTTGAVAAKTFSYSAGDVGFNFPGTAGSAVFLTASTYTDGGRTFTSGNSVDALGSFTNSNATTSTSRTDTLTSAGKQGFSTTEQINPRGATYSLAELGGILSLNGAANTNVQFLSKAVVAMPEPGAVLIGLAGMPCMGLVLLIARRRARVSPVVA